MPTTIPTTMPTTTAAAVVVGSVAMTVSAIQSFYPKARDHHIA
jgi:hypothetical protein